MELGNHLFDDIVVILVAAGVGGLGARLLRLPPLIGYLVAGAVVGPHALALVTQLEDVQTLAEFGVILLLFAVGVEISLSDLRRLGWRVLVASAAQIVLTIAVGYGIGTALGWGPQASLTAGMALSPQQHYGRTENTERPGRVGRAARTSRSGDAAGAGPCICADDGGDRGAGRGWRVPRQGTGRQRGRKAAVILAGVLFVGSLGLPWLLKRVALVGARESFVMTVMAAALGAAALTSWGGLSAPLGAFVAGLVLSESDWAGRRALSEVIPVRDIFAAFFFVSLGMLTDFDFLASHMGEVALFIGASIVVKFFLINVLVRVLGYLPDTAARTGFLMIQIGEFSFIVAGTAVATGVAGEELLPLIITAAVVTMGITPGFVSVGSKSTDAPPSALQIVRTAPRGRSGSGISAGARPRTAWTRDHRRLRARRVAHRPGSQPPRGALHSDRVRPGHLFAGDCIQRCPHLRRRDERSSADGSRRAARAAIRRGASGACVGTGRRAAREAAQPAGPHRQPRRAAGRSARTGGQRRGRKSSGRNWRLLWR